MHMNVMFFDTKILCRKTTQGRDTQNSSKQNHETLFVVYY